MHARSSPPSLQAAANAGPRSTAAALWVWRHPRAVGAAGRCIGRTDLSVDPRKAKRLAHRIRSAARRHGLPRRVWVSPLQRARAVGGWLRRWGFELHVDARLMELDFGRWDGRRWDQVAWAEVQAWEEDLLHHAPGGGESLQQLATRAQAFAADADRTVGADVDHAVGAVGPRLAVSHGGWINALRHVQPRAARLAASDWPAPVPYGTLVRWP